MNGLREFVAVLLWITSVVSLLNCIFVSFSAKLILLALVCFIAAYFIWPSRRRGHREDDYWWLDLAELLIEAPVLLVRFIVRVITHID